VRTRMPRPRGLLRVGRAGAGDLPTVSTFMWEVGAREATSSRRRSRRSGLKVDSAIASANYVHNPHATPHVAQSIEQRLRRNSLRLLATDDLEFLDI